MCRARAPWAAVMAICLTGCRLDMHDQPKYKPLRPSPFFGDGLSARPLVPGTVARGFLREDAELYTGKVGGITGPTPDIAQDQEPGATPVVQAGPPDLPTMPGGTDVDAFTFPVGPEVLLRGQQRFDIFCSPCHSRVGNGEGMVAQRGFRRPPSFHTDRLRVAKVGHFYDVIANGFGAMPLYAEQVPPLDRWAIVAYIRALQLSQHATLADVPPSEQPGLLARTQAVAPPWPTIEHLGPGPRPRLAPPRAPAGSMPREMGEQDWRGVMGTDPSYSAPAEERP